MPNAEQQIPVQQDENQLVAERRTKLAEWRKTGKAFPNDFQRENTAAKLLELYAEKTSEELEAMPVEVKVADRMMLKRKALPPPSRSHRPGGRGSRASAGASRRMRRFSSTLTASAPRAVQEGQPIAPAAEWLLDNFHLVEQQLRQIGDDLPPGYYRQLPKLSDGPFAGYPRVFGLAWAYVAHTDSLLSGQVLRRYGTAYQQVQPLTIGELWAIAITLRIVLIENMRRLAVEIIEGHAQRLRADQLVDDVLSARTRAEHSQALAFQKAIAPHENLTLSETVAAQIAKRLRKQMLLL